MAFKFILSAIVFLLTLAFGVWLSRRGKPYKNALFNVHKLVALGFVIFISVILYPVIKSSHTQVLHIGFVFLAGASILALFLSGALMSIGKPDIRYLRPIHQIAPALLALAIAAVIYLIGFTPL